MPWPESWCPSKFICYNLISTVSKGTGLWTEHTQSHTHTHAHKPFHECDYCTQERVPGASDNLCLWNSALRCYSGASGSHQMIQLSGPWPSTSRAIFNPRLLLYQGLIFWLEQLGRTTSPGSTHSQGPTGQGPFSIPETRSEGDSWPREGLVLRGAQRFSKSLEVGEEWKKKEESISNPREDHRTSQRPRGSEAPCQGGAEGAGRAAWPSLQQLHH